MKRLVYEKFLEWNRKNQRKPLIVMGARQVGKTWLMEEFARREYPGNSVVFNLMKNATLRRRFADVDLDAESVVDLLQLASGRRIVPGKTLVVIDEIQEEPRALTALKYLHEELPDLAVMVAGSLLGLSVKRENDETDEDVKDASYPVGNVDYIDVHPMSFAEFLLAIGEELKAEYIAAGKWTALKGVHGDLQEFVRRYYFVGGMPEAVRTYAETGDLGQVRRVQNRILRDYDKDFAKHAKPRLLAKIRLLWNSIPSQLAKENKKFVYAALRQGARAREYETALIWLRDAGMVHVVSNVSTPMIPLKAHETFGAFKLYVHDVGLLAAMCELPSGVLLEKTEIFSTAKGAFTEQYVLEEFVALGMTPYYWTPDDGGKAEVEFLLQGENGVYPVEVKAETNLKAQSLKSYFDRYHPRREIRVSMHEWSRGERIDDIPLYAVPAVLGILKMARDPAKPL